MGLIRLQNYVWNSQEKTISPPKALIKCGAGALAREKSAIAGSRRRHKRLNQSFPKAFLCALCVSAVIPPHPAYIPIPLSIARRHTAQNLLCRVNMMQSTSGR
jgi:hypothetical protein